MTESLVKVAVVTGASAGVGRATALAFARQGAAVALLARGRDGLEAAKRDIEALGGRALVLPVDVAEAGQVDAAAARVEQELGPIDVWVNNAMVTVISPVTDMQPEEYQRVTQVSYLGAVYGTLAALRHMRPRNRGTIIQVGSALSYRAIPLQSAYCAAKFALRGFTDSLRSELLHENSAIHVSMVQLSAFNTPQFDWARHRLPNRPQPLAPVFQPEVAAQGIVWAAGQRRREICIGFPALKTIMGQKLLPGLADHLASNQAYEGQADTSAPPPDPERRDNLYEPLPGDAGSHGRFDSRARPRSWQLALSMHRSSLLLGSVLLFTALRLARPRGR